MKGTSQKPLRVWIFQTGEPLHIDLDNPRPMRGMNLANMLVKSGHHVVLWSAAFNHLKKTHRTRKAETIRIQDRLEIRLIPSCGYRENISVSRLVDHAQLALNLKKLINRETKLPDVAFVGFPPIEAAAVVTRWLKEKGIPCVLDAKDQWPHLFLSAFPGILKPFGKTVLWPYYYLARRAMRDATGLSAMADGFLEWCRIFSSRPQTEMDGVFPLTSPTGQRLPLDLQTARDWWRSQGVLKEEQICIMFVGSHMSTFDFMPVADAAKKSCLSSAGSQKQIQYVICGDGGSSREMRATMSGLPNVTFPGWVNRAQVEALAERSIAALIPYKNTDDYMRSIPNKVIDAFLLGLPILTPLRGEVEKLISGHNVGLRYGTDTSLSLHDCIQMLIDNPELQRQMSQNARTLYQEKFLFEKVYGDFVKHLETLANLDLKS